MNQQMILMDLGIHGAFDQVEKLNFVMPVKNAESFIGRGTGAVIYLKHQEREAAAIIGVMGIDGIFVIHGNPPYLVIF